MCFLNTKLLFAQDLKGLWVGSLVSDTVGVPVINTEYVLNIKEQHENTLSGRAYVIEKEYEFEGVLDFIAVLDKGRLKISELRIVSSKVPTQNKILCIKFLNLGLSLGETTDYLKGHWTGALEDHSHCTPGMAVLERAKSGKAKPISNAILTMIATDTAPNGFLNTKLATPALVNVQNTFLELEISDYLKEDGDTISLYLNRRPLVRKLPILRKLQKKSLRINPNTGITELILYAENLGQVPPNTCVLTVFDGFTRQRVRIESTKETSATIYFRYQPPGR